MRDWAAVRAPLQPPERSMRFAKRIGFLLVLIGFVVTIIVVLPDDKTPHYSRNRFSRSLLVTSPLINMTYPHTKPRRLADGSRVYRIGIVADLDTESAVRSSNGKSTLKWVSYLKRGDLVIAENLRAEIRWDATPMRVTLSSSLGERGRGMELSDLAFFNGKLLAVDDRTGIVFNIRGFDRDDVTEIAVVPWAILTDGPGGVAKGFKGEWMTIRDRHLYVGGLGKVWTTTQGEVRNAHPQWVKKVGPLGGVRHVNWINNYDSLHTALGIQHPGYVIHEAVCWSDVHRRWFFLPRRASQLPYNDVDDERRATNLLISCDEKFKNVKYRKIGALSLTVGFSSFKFVPGTEDTVIVAVKSEEDRGRIASYLTVFTIDGDILMEPTAVGDETKYEGVEFL